jgi:peptidoglycan hydrolase-like protein with peptidoglycan-binding domain
MIVSALALGATVFAGGALSPNTPTAEAASKGECAAYVSAWGSKNSFQVYMPSRMGWPGCTVSVNGLTNAGVGVLQQTLQTCYNQDIKWDNIFGPKTKAAVKNAQAKHSGLVQDGIYGPNTHNRIEHIRVGGWKCDFHPYWV